MGTTAASLKTSNIRAGYVLAIEGFKFILTSAADKSLAVTAWTSTPWSQALGGLSVEGIYSQSLQPWSNELDVPSLTFAVVPEDSSEVFAKAMFQGKASARSELVVGFGADEDGGAGFTGVVRDASVFSTGTVYVNNQALDITSPTGNDLPVDANGQGVFAPFGTNSGPANTFPMPGSLSNENATNTGQTAERVVVSDGPETWVGKRVALHLHRIDGGVWDSYSQSEMLFCGIIDRVYEDERGVTMLQCESILRQVKDSTLMRDQFTAAVAEGYNFQATQWVRATLNGNGGAPATSAKLNISGYYTASEFADALTAHLDADATVGRPSTPAKRWGCAVSSGNSGFQFVVGATGSSSSEYILTLDASDESILKFLGFENIASYDGGAVAFGPKHYGTYHHVASETPPFKYQPLGRSESSFTPATISLSDGDGAYFDHTANLPPDAQQMVETGDNWSYFTLGDGALFLAKITASDASGRPTTLARIHTNTGIRKKSTSPTQLGGIRWGESQSMRVKQVLFYVGNFSDSVAKIFSSIDGNGANHSTYDVLGAGGGCGIPWSLLGANFVNSLENIEEGDVDGALCIIAEKPIRVWDLLVSEFALRLAAPVWKDGGIQIAQLTIPNATTAEHSLTISTKSDARRTIVDQTSEYLTTTLKIEYDRDIVEDNYQSEFITISGTSAGRGPGRVKTIKARNCYGAIAATGATVEAIADQLASKFLPVFARPLKRIKTSINHNHFHAAPGDQVTLTDSFVRNPTTGARGITARPATIMEISYSLGIASETDYMGEVTLLYTDEDRLFPLAPCAEHDNTYGTGAYTNGRDPTTGTFDRLAIKQSEYGGSVTSHFAVNDQIRVVEVDPADVTSPDTFVTTITAIGSSPDYIELGADFGGGNPAFDGTKTYRITYDDYTTSAGGANSAQLLVAHIADGLDDGAGNYGDGLIQDTIDPNLLADENLISTVTSADLTLLPARHSDLSFAEGEPFHAGLYRDAVRMANNLISYKCAQQAPMMGAEIITNSLGGASNYILMLTRPFAVGRGHVPGGFTRKLYVAPSFNSSAGATTNCRVTLSVAPPRGESFTNAVFVGAIQRTIFTTTSTTLQFPAAVGLVPPRDEQFDGGMTFITVEVSENSAFAGLCELRLGPLEAV